MLSKGLPSVLLLCGVLGLWAVPGELLAAPPKTAPKEADSEAKKGGKQADRRDPAVAELVGRLAHDEFDVRRQAQASLLEWGLKSLDQGIDSLYEVYRNSEDPEVRFRSREVLKRLVIVKQPWDGEGYLGIQMEAGRVKGADGELHPAVAVTVVREGTAAEDSGLMMNDVITGVDRIVFNDLAPTRMFADYIRSKKPGDTINLHVLRDGERKEFAAVLRRRSPLLDQLGQWGTQLNLPEQAELDESDFQEWFKKKARGEKRGKE